MSPSVENYTDVFYTTKCHTGHLFLCAVNGCAFWDSHRDIHVGFSSVPLTQGTARDHINSDLKFQSSLWYETTLIHCSLSGANLLIFYVGLYMSTHRRCGPQFYFPVLGLSSLSTSLILASYNPELFIFFYVLQHLV